MKELVPLLLGLLGAGLSMLVWREQFRAHAERRDQFTDDALQRDWRFRKHFGEALSLSGRHLQRVDRGGAPADRIAIAAIQQRPADVTNVAALVEIGSALAAARG